MANPAEYSKPTEDHDKTEEKQEDQNVDRDGRERHPPDQNEESKKHT